MRGRWITSSLFVALLFAAPAVAEDGGDKKWSLSASIGYQSDDNVTTDEIDNVSNVADTAFVFDAAIAYKLLQGDAIDLEIGYDFSQSFYDAESEFDLRSHSLSVSADKEIAGLDAGLFYIYTRSDLGGSDFLGAHSLTASLGYSATPIWYLSASYNAQDKNFVSDDDRDARVHGVGINNFVFFMDSKAYVSFGYRIEDENADGPQFDYFGHFLHLRVKTPIPIDALARFNPTATFGWAYYNKDYSNVTASIGDERKDTRTTLTAGLTMDYNAHLGAKLAYERIEAISNLTTSDYEEDIITFSVKFTY